MAELDQDQLKQLAERILNQLGLKGASRRNLVIELLKRYRGDYSRSLWKAKRVFLADRLKSAEHPSDPS